MLLVLNIKVNIDLNLLSILNVRILLSAVFSRWVFSSILISKQVMSILSIITFKIIKPV